MHSVLLVARQGSAVSHYFSVYKYISAVVRYFEVYNKQVPVIYVLQLIELSECPVS
jgi:hypothetical protein